MAHLRIPKKHLHYHVKVGIVLIGIKLKRICLQIFGMLHIPSLEFYAFHPSSVDSELILTIRVEAVVGSPQATIEERRDVLQRLIHSLSLDDPTIHRRVWLVP
mmetsp:Transcript_25445/g.60182  ORF Transcript_25445/g.60182 Transcript_25445/m.60182 type:complete len:103 (+) Transcript_25445:176-484(+)